MKKVKTILMAAVVTTSMTSLAKADDFNIMPNNGYYVNTAYNGTPYNYRFLAIDSTLHNRTAENMANIQQALMNEGYNIGPNAVTGHWNNSTAQAVKEFQANNHIKVDGVVGASTATALNDNNFTVRNNVAMNNIGSNYSKNMATIQGELIELGFNVGRNGVNGVYNNDTAEAIKLFQIQHSLNVNGIADASTVSIMNSAVTNRRALEASSVQPWHDGSASYTVSGIPVSY